MQRQLTRMERDVNKIVEHKELTESCCGLKEEVTQFVKIFREELLTQDERGREMTDTYKKILVCCCIHPSIHSSIYPSTYFSSIYSSIIRLFLSLCSNRNNLVSLPILIVKIFLIIFQFLSNTFEEFIKNSFLHPNHLLKCQEKGMSCTPLFIHSSS